MVNKTTIIWVIKMKVSCYLSHFPFFWFSIKTKMIKDLTTCHQFTTCKVSKLIHQCFLLVREWKQKMELFHRNVYFFMLDAAQELIQRWENTNVSKSLLLVIFFLLVASINIVLRDSTNTFNIIVSSNYTSC